MGCLGWASKCVWTYTSAGAMQRRHAHPIGETIHTDEERGLLSKGRLRRLVSTPVCWELQIIHMEQAIEKRSHSPVRERNGEKTRGGENTLVRKFPMYI